MSRTIPYDDLKRMLMEEYDYDEHDAVYTIAQLRKADRETLDGFLEFYETGEVPEWRIHDVLVADLMKARDLNPFAAFLAIAWLADEPQKARFHLMNPVMSQKPGKKTLAHIREVAKARGWDLSAPSLPEDTSDLVITE